MEVMKYLISFFLEDIQKVFGKCLVLFQRYDFWKTCFRSSFMKSEDGHFRQKTTVAEFLSLSISVVDPVIPDPRS